MKNKIILLLIFCLWSVGVKAQTYTISTIAGVSGTHGYYGDGGPATSALFSNLINGCAIDASGNIYVCDITHDVVRKINTSGIITTVAGTGIGGYTGDSGPATDARLNAPWGVAVDNSGNIFILDNNIRVRRVDNATGTITTIAGATSIGRNTGDGGPATSANLQAYSIAVDGSGNIYLGCLSSSGFGNMYSTIRKINTSGQIDALTDTAYGYGGDGGSASLARVREPYGMTVDASGNIYFADFLSNRIRKIDASGNINTIAGTCVSGYSGDGGPATDAKLLGGAGILVDPSGNVYFTDKDNFRVRKISTSGTITTIAGNGTQGYSGDNGSATSAQINVSYGLVMDACGNINVVDIDVVRRLTLDVPAITGVTTLCAGTMTTLADATTGGTWSSTNTTIATIDASSGALYAVAGGSTTITYTTSCGTFATTPVTVNPLPTISGSSVTICNGLSTTLTATGGATYTWSPGTGLSVTTGATPVASPTTTTAYTVTGTNANGCVSTGTATVTVNDLPVVAAISGSTTILCAATNLTLTDATSDGTWSSSATAVATVSSSGVVRGVAGGTTDISYAVTNSCGTTTVSYAVTVNPLPNAGVITPTALGKVFVCQNSNVTITSSGDAGGTWAISVAGFATISSSGTVYGVFGPASVPVISYTVSNSCGTAYDTIKLTVKGIPGFSGIPNACVNTSSHVTGVPATASVTWMLGAPAFTETVVGAVASYTVNAAGSDTVVITVPTETATYCAGTLKVPIKGNPIPVQPVISGVNYVTSGGTITLTSATGGTGLWGTSNPSAATGSGAGVSKLISAVGSIGSSTIISLTFTLFPCTLTDTQMVTVVSPKGIAPGETELGAGDVLSVYPNPSGGAFTIQLPAGSGTAAITIADITGKIVYAKITGKDKLDFDLADYPRGMYTISVTAGDKKYREKVLIE